ncbi:MAG: hypothetical protein F4108_04495 [Acidimicrobiaceae bacterium]|nr:hypothetical protein [Acidimicrobiaceae bacterium]
MQIAEWDDLRTRLEDPDSPVDVPDSGEFAPQIIHSLETGTDRRVYVNVRNGGLIDNLPEACIVEVPATVSGAGVSPDPVGRIPAHLAALIRTNIAPQELTVEALKSGSRESVYHAAMLDPRTAAELDLDQIWSLVDALVEAHGEFIPQPLRLVNGSIGG